MAAQRQESHLRTYGVGIIGLGVMGRAMAEAMAAHPRFRVVAGFDPAIGPEDPIRDRVALCADAASVAADPAVDCLYVASPPARHEDAVRLAVAARKPLLCEKPLAATTEAAWRSVEAVEAARLPAAVNFIFATEPAAVRLAALAQSGALGPVEAARLTLRFRAWPRGWQRRAGSWLAGAAEGGFTREVASHFLFLANRLLGRPRIDQVSVERGSAGTETRLGARLVYPAATLEIDGAVAGEREDENRFELIGSKGTVALIDWERLERDGAPVALEPAPAGQLDGLAALLDGKPHSLCSFREAAEVVDLVEAMLAARTGSPFAGGGPAAQPR
ncbi:MAG: Gfo/Idh/MocA family protein [Pseudomonadota bacterium]